MPLIFSFSELEKFFFIINYDLIVPTFFIIVSVLLISTIPTYSFKKIVIPRTMTKFLLFGIVLFFGALLFFTGVGLCVRKRFAYLLALFIPLVFIIRFFSTAAGYGTGSISPSQYYDLCNAMITIGVCFYLFEGDRPNFIFRRRYRSYRTELEQESR